MSNPTWWMALLQRMSKVICPQSFKSLMFMHRLEHGRYVPSTSPKKSQQTAPFLRSPIFLRELMRHHHHRMALNTRAILTDPWHSHHFARVSSKTDYPEGDRMDLRRWKKKRTPLQLAQIAHSLTLQTYFSVILIRQKVATRPPLFMLRYHILQRLQTTAWRIFQTVVTKKRGSFFTISLYIFSLLSTTSSTGLQVAFSVIQRNGKQDMAQHMCICDTQYMVQLMKFMKLDAPW